MIHTEESDNFVLFKQYNLKMPKFVKPCIPGPHQSIDQHLMLIKWYSVAIFSLMFFLLMFLVFGAFLNVHFSYMLLDNYYKEYQDGLCNHDSVIFYGVINNVYHNTKTNKYLLETKIYPKLLTYSPNDNDEPSLASFTKTISATEDQFERLKLQSAHDYRHEIKVYRQCYSMLMYTYHMKLDAYDYFLEPPNIKNTGTIALILIFILWISYILFSLFLMYVGGMIFFFRKLAKKYVENQKSSYV